MQATAMPMTLVLVEDSLTIRRQLLQQLASVPGLRVVGEAADETTALTLIGHLRPDAVLLDLSLAQGGSGLAVLKALRKQGYAGQVHVLSHQTDAYRAAVLAAGANGFFDKAEELDVMLRQLIGQAELPAPHASRPGDAQLCVVQIDSDDTPTLRERLDVLAPDTRLGQARLPDDALSAGGLMAVAELRALGKLPS